MDKLQTYLKRTRVIPIVLIAVVLTSCAGRLDKPRHPSVIDPNNPSNQYTLEEYKLDKQAYRTAFINKDYEQARILRNIMINRIMTDIDYSYEEYALSLTTNKSTIDFATDLAGLGIAFSTVVVGSASAKTILGATQTALTGASLSFNQNYFREHTTEFLAIQMEANRTKVKNTIDNKWVNLDVIQYPLEEALRDLDDYFYAGTLYKAFIALAAEVGNEVNDQNEEADKLTELRVESKFEFDANSKILRRLLIPRPNDVNEEFKTELLQFMEQNNVDTSIPFFLNSEKFKDERKQAVQELIIDKNQNPPGEKQEE